MRSAISKPSTTARETMTVTEFKMWNNTVENIVEVAFFHDDTYTKFTVSKAMFNDALRETFNKEVE